MPRFTRLFAACFMLGAGLGLPAVAEIRIFECTDRNQGISLELFPDPNWPSNQIGRLRIEGLLAGRIGVITESGGKISGSFEGGEVFEIRTDPSELIIKPYVSFGESDDEYRHMTVCSLRMRTY